MESPKLDSQCKALYKWEGEFPCFDNKMLTLKQCRSAVAWACKLYRVPIPPVSIHPLKKGSSFSCDDPYMLCLNKRHMNVGICLHESAHAIHTYLMGHAHETHGPQFLAIYMNLLLKAGGISKRALISSLKSLDLEWRPLSLLSPHRIRKTYRRVITNKKNQD